MGTTAPSATRGVCVTPHFLHRDVLKHSSKLTAAGFASSLRPRKKHPADTALPALAPLCFAVSS